jgi:hypothetical protein
MNVPLWHAQVAEVGGVRGSGAAGTGHVGVGQCQRKHPRRRHRISRHPAFVLARGVVIEHSARSKRGGSVVLPAFKVAQRLRAAPNTAWRGVAPLEPTPVRAALRSTGGRQAFSHPAPNTSIERTVSSSLRSLETAAHVER